MNIDIMTANRCKVGIVGAGPSGLSLARQLKAAGISFQIHEKHSGVGGLWDIDNPGSPMYESAHFISSRTKSGFYDYPMPEDYPDYPHRKLILKYIRDFVAEFALEQHIRFNAQVVKTQQVESGWRVTETGGEAFHYDYLVCASGINWQPQMPDIPGEFNGQQIHSVDYRNVDSLKGKKVLVVGAGNSGCDIACDAAQVADKAFISVRRGYYFIPKHIMGVPADVYDARFPWLPTKIKQLTFPWLLRLSARVPWKYGLPRPDHKMFESHPIMNDQLLHYLAHGDISAKADVARLDGDSVIFKDGSKEQIDAIIYATGYKSRIAYVDDALLQYSGDRPDLYLNVFHRKLNNLFAIGFLETNSGAFTLFDHMSHLVVNYIKERDSASEKAIKFESLIHKDEPDVSGGVNYVKSGRHANYVNKNAYLNYLKKLNQRMGWSQLASMSFNGGTR